MHVAFTMRRTKLIIRPNIKPINESKTLKDEIINLSEKNLQESSSSNYSENYHQEIPKKLENNISQSVTDIGKIKYHSRKKLDFNKPLISESDVQNLTMKDLVFMNPKANPFTSQVPIKEPCHLSINATEQSENNINSFINTLVPRLKVGPDGNIIIDSQSLFLSNPNKNTEIFEKQAVQEDFDPFSHLKYTRKHKHHKAWSSQENRLFYEALSRHGINLIAVASEIPGRERDEVKNKFKREERLNPQLIDMSLQQHPKLEKYLKILYPPKFVATKNQQESVSTKIENLTRDHLENYKRERGSESSKSLRDVAECLEPYVSDESHNLCDTDTESIISIDSNLLSESDIPIIDKYDDERPEIELRRIFKRTKSGRTPKITQRYSDLPSNSQYHSASCANHDFTPKVLNTLHELNKRKLLYGYNTTFKPFHFQILNSEKEASDTVISNDMLLMPQQKVLPFIPPHLTTNESKELDTNLTCRAIQIGEIEGSFLFDQVVEQEIVIEETVEFDDVNSSIS